MRIISWNVNGIRACEKKGFLDFLYEQQPDFLCVQETKAQSEQLSAALLEPEGYTTYWQSAERKGYSGTAIFAKTPPLSVGVLGVEAFDVEGRVQVADLGDFVLVNAYYPNSQPERARIDYKVAFCDAMQAFCEQLVKEGRHVLVVGDYNIAHTEIDLARPKANENSAGYYIEERQALTRFLEAGYADTFRLFNSEPEHYTWWSYRARARERNVGWRIDVACVNNEFIPQVKAAGILPEVLGSDHCPITVDLKL